MQKKPEVLPAKPRQEKPEGTIYIGSKPTMAYVIAVVSQFSRGLTEIRVKARGRTISKAVDVAEIVRGRFVQTAKVKSVGIGTEKITEDGKESNVSTIEIVLGKQ